MKSIKQRLRLTIIFFLIMITISIYLGIHKPLSDELEMEVINSHHLNAQNKLQVFDTYLLSLKYNAASLSSRTAIRDMLDDYNKGLVSFDELKTFTMSRYEDGVTVFKELNSIARITRDGLVVYSIGPDKNIANFVDWGKKELITKYIHGNKLIIVQSPIKKGEELLGYDIILSDISSIISEIEGETYHIELLDEKHDNEEVVKNGRVISYLQYEPLDISIAISTDEKSVLGDIQELAVRINIRYYIILFIMFIIIQSLIVRYIGKFLTKQEELKNSAENREKEKNLLIKEMNKGFLLLKKINDIQGVSNIYEVIDANRTFELMSNRDLSMLLGMNLSQVLGMSEDQLENIIKELIHKESKQLEIFIKAYNSWWQISAYYPQDGYLAIVCEDITLHKEAEIDLYVEKELLQSTLLSVGDGVITTDINGKICIFNPAAEVLSGWSNLDALGKNIFEVFKLTNPKTNTPFIWRNAIEFENQLTSSNNDENELITYSGKGLKIFKNIAPIKLPNGQTSGYVIIFRDITEAHEKHKRIEYMSFHDEMTGLYNRRYMEDSLHRLDTPHNIPITIMILDLNNLKLTNDIFGHELGDNLIKKAAEVLKNVLRSDDIICRIGGDEFCIIMPKTSSEVALSIKDRIHRESINYQTGPMRLSVAIGYAVKTNKSQNISDILRDSDLNMYQNKQERRQQVKNRTLEDFLENNCMRIEEEVRHNNRVGIFSEALYEAIGKSQAEVCAFKKVAKIHDVGKVVVPEDIINKRGELTKEEWDILKRHSLAGYQILKLLKEHEAYSEAILYHHERFDGKGYPEGILGENIPLEARVIAIADAYEAMTSNRVYKRAMSKEKAIEQLKQNSGTQFDPKLVNIFINKVLPKYLE